MRLGRNLLAGLAGSIWTALVGLAVVPFYLKYVGIEAYGLVGFLVTTQSILQILDLGLAPTVNREIARCSATGNLAGAGSLLHTLAVIYFLMAAGIGLVIIGVAPFIARYWLHAEHITLETVTHALMLMGVVIAFRWPVGLYQGALIGAQRLALSSGVSSLVLTLGSVGAVGVLAFVSPTIQALFAWQACVAVVHTATMRWAAWRVIGHGNGERFDLGGLRNTWRFSAGMTGIAVSALVLTQLDKLVLSKTLILSEFGHYMLASVVASGLYVLITPFFNAVYPRLSALVARGDSARLTEIYRVGTRLMGAMLFPVAVMLVLFSDDVVHVWTGNPRLAEDVAPLITLLAMGSALHGVMYFPYALQLAYGRTRLPLIINTILMILLVPLIVILSLSYGAIGGAVAWLVLHVLYLLLGTWLTHRSLLRGIAVRWLTVDVGIPLVISWAIILVGEMVIRSWVDSTYLRLICAIAFAICATLLSIIATRDVRVLVMGSISRWLDQSIPKHFRNKPMLVRK